MKDQSILEHRLYFIKDEFFDLVADPYLKQNKSTTKRPHYYVLKDPQTSLLWMIPCSTQIDKYEKIIAERKARNVPHNHIQIIRVNGRREAFLYQDMFPVIPDYVESVYANVTGIFEIKDRKDIEKVQENAIKIIKLLRHGVAFTKAQPNAMRVEEMMIEELKKRGVAGGLLPFDIGRCASPLLLEVAFSFLRTFMGVNGIGGPGRSESMRRSAQRVLLWVVQSH